MIAIRVSVLVRLAQEVVRANAPNMVPSDRLQGRARRMPGS
jgi:hypothetical protein